jgi:hypothetical protein
MNTKQFLVLGLSLALVANVAAMNKETPKQRQLREQKEAALRRIAEQKAERAAANKKPATPAVTPAVTTPAPLAPAVKQPLVKAIVVPVNIKNDNNAIVVKDPAKAAAVPLNVNNNNNVVVVKEPAKKATQPATVPAKPIAPAVEPKGKEELNNEEPSVWLRDKAQYLAEYKTAIAQYCEQALKTTDDQMAKSLRTSFVDAERSRPIINRLNELALTKLQTIQDAYANDQDFAQLRTQFQALVTIYNTQEQLLEDVHNQELWTLMDVTLTGLINEQNPNTAFTRTLIKLKKGFAGAHTMIIESAQDIFSEEDANLEAIRQMEELNREEAARASEEAIRIFQQEEEARRLEEANGEAVARLLDEENRHAATGNDALLAQEAADLFAREQEEEDLARALSLQEDDRPAVDNDALLAEAMTAQIAAEQEEANLMAALALQEDNQQPRETDEEIARRMQNEWNGQ